MARTPGSHAADEQIERIAALADPVRRALYRFVSAQPDAVGRDAVATGVGVPRHVAKFHLDRLAQEGLLEVEFRRPPGRTGPGAGRPAKLYRRSPGAVAVSVPERRYEVVGRVLARAITEARGDDARLVEDVNVAARAVGHDLAGTVAQDLAAVAQDLAAANESDVAAASEHNRDRSTEHASRRGRARQLDAVAEVLAELGYEPRVGRAAIELANCPFHQLASEYTDLVCGMNLALIEGVLDELDQPALQARLDPAAWRCCVTVTAAGARGRPR
jgi:predicted ArsR family transcriptional regulator